MSIAAIAWVFSQRIKPSWLKFLLVALADNTNDLGEAWPSITAICQKTSLNRKTVIDGLDELEKRNLVEDTGRRTGPTSSIKVYRLLGRLAQQSRTLMHLRKIPYIRCGYRTCLFDVAKVRAALEKFEVKAATK
jgi:pyocin large subunit-like protein